MAIKTFAEQGINIDEFINKYGYEDTTSWGRIFTRCIARDQKDRAHWEDRIDEKSSSLTDTDVEMMEEAIEIVYNYEEPTEE
ncbi:MAG: hypothetical protein ACI3T9_02385 [Romboutsia timonensis]